MKRFYTLFVAVFVMAIAFAQNGKFTSIRSLNSVMDKDMTAKLSKHKAAAHKAAPQELTLPLGLTPECWIFGGSTIVDDEDESEGEEEEGYDDSEESDMGSQIVVNNIIYLAFDNANNEVYIKGLCTPLPDAWVKGKISGNKLTIPTGQYYGSTTYEGQDYSLYLLGCDAETNSITDLVFDISEDKKILTLDKNTLLVNSFSQTSIDQINGLYFNIYAISPDDNAVMPSAPAIVDVYDAFSEGKDFSEIAISIPLFDENFEFIAPDKLSYKIYLDKDGQISEYVFKASMYDALSTDATEIPYTLNDNYDFAYYMIQDIKYIYPYLSINSYDRIGVQSIYYGGGKTNTTEIAWFNIHEDATSVRSVVADEKTDVSIYNITGQRISQQTKGINIINGKKVIVR